ncbi:MAG: DNA polymerase III subunit alpha [Bacilli bacterium]
MLTALEVKTSYSILGSLNKIDKLVNKAKELNYSSLAITDTNNMFGAYEFYLECKKKGIKPIIGMEIENNNDKFILLAKNNKGYKNLIKLATTISEGNINYDDLEKYASDIILIMPYLHYNKDIIAIYDEYFVGYSNIEEKNSINEKKVLINDASYLEENDFKYLDYLFMIRDDKKLGEVELGTLKGKHLLNSEEFNNLTDKDVISNMETIVNECNVSLEYTEGLLPVYDENIDAFEFLSNLCNKGLNKRLNGNIPKVYKERLDYELKVIKEMGFCDYFLVVWDYVRYAKLNNILVGPGRGSAAGSLACYAIGITDVDPIKYDLLFERFLNPERVTMPDIDIDFDSEKRGQVVDYVTQKYGSKRAIGIITFNTLGAKQVIRDVGRCMNISLPIIDEIAKSITSKELENSYVMGSSFYRIINSREEYKRLYDISLHLEGLPRHISIHAAGIVMSRYDIDEIIPLYKNQLGIYTTAFSKDYLEPLGLLKMDFLGLDNLTLLSNVINDIREKEKINISFSKIPLDDKKTLKIFYDVDTDGIFQFESPGMKRFLKKIKVNNFDDIALALALYRPGPMDNIDSFIARREGREKIDYIHPDLEDILKPTYGIIVYQEQIMQIVRRLAGYSYGEADILRRAMSKKKEDIILKERPKFIKGCLDNGYDEKTANKVYDLILKFANYGFNKSHSVAYSIIAYKMAFIKTYFLKYFICGLLTNVIGNTSKTNIYLNRARQAGIRILSPSINDSTKVYYVSPTGIRCPLSIISNVGTSISNDIIKEREKGKFNDFCDFVLRMDSSSVNKRVITNLIFAGAFDCFDYNKKTLVQNLDNVINYADIARDAGMIEIEKPEIEIVTEYTKEEIINMELKVIGFYLTEHPVSKFRTNIFVNSVNICEHFDKNVTVVVMISKIRETTTKNNDVMAFVVGSDEFGEINFTIFPNVYKRFNNIKTGNITSISGRVEKRFDKYQVIVNNIKILE